MLTWGIQYGGIFLPDEESRPLRFRGPGGSGFRCGVGFRQVLASCVKYKRENHWRRSTDAGRHVTVSYTGASRSKPAGILQRLHIVSARAYALITHFVVAGGRTTGIRPTPGRYAPGLSQIITVVVVQHHQSVKAGNPAAQSRQVEFGKCRCGDAPSWFQFGA